jgi:hypothetical protein
MRPRDFKTSSLAAVALLMTWGATLLVCHAQQTSPIKADSAPTQSNPVAGEEPIYKIGTGISPPKLVHSEEPKLSKAIRKSKESETTWIRVKLCVEANGTPSNITVVGVVDKAGAPIADTDSDPIYGELKEGAMEAAKRYRFEPGKKSGTPVRVWIVVAVNIHSS